MVCITKWTTNTVIYWASVARCYSTELPGASWCKSDVLCIYAEPYPLDGCDYTPYLYSACRTAKLKVPFDCYCTGDADSEMKMICRQACDSYPNFPCFNFLSFRKVWIARLWMGVAIVGRSTWWGVQKRMEQLHNWGAYIPLNYVGL